MPTIDDKIVAMSFESSKFEQGVDRSINSIDKLKQSLAFPNAGKGLEEVNKAAQNHQLGLIGRAVEAILPKLEALRLVAISVLSNIANQALATGTQFVKSLTVEPIIGGLKEYATQLNSVQTILANTQAAGTTLEDVNSALDTLNEYSDKTIYNFGQMARNIGTFTAAGVELDVATGAIKGIANLAALSGSNAEQASTAMYQLSQALATGRVTLMDWNSVVNAGMGGTVFQRALAQTAEKMGTLDKGAVKLTGKMKNVSIAGESFRNSLAAAPGKESWLTSEVLTKTLAQFTGDLSDAELAAQGFTKAEIMAIQQQAKTAMEAATQVKTLEGVLSTAKETAVSGWAQTWEIVFGDFEEAKTLFTGISDAINGFINRSADARNAVLTHWKQLGGRTQLIAAIGNVFRALGRVIEPIKEAFREFFPKTTGRDLFDLTERFREFSLKLSPMKETVDLLKRTFRGVFAVLSIGKEVLFGIFDVFKKVFDTIFSGTGSFLEFTAAIGDWLVELEDALVKGGELEDFFSGLGDILVVPIEMLGKFADAIGSLFDGFDSGGISGEMGGIGGIFDAAGNAIEKFLEKFSDTDKFFDVFFDSFSTVAKELGPALADAFANMNFDAILQVLRTGLVAGIFLMIKRFLGKGSLVKQLGGGKGGVVDTITGAFGALQSQMVAMQQNIQADTLMKIAIAIGILTASVVAISFIDPDRLKSAMTGMAVAFGQLLGAMAVLTAITKTTGFIKTPLIAASLILLATAILILTASVAILSRLSWEELLKGLVGVGVLLGIISAAVIPLSANAAGMTRAGVGIGAIAVGLLILAFAVEKFGNMEWGEMAKGLIGVGVALGILVAATQVISASGMVRAGVGLLLISAALLILAEAVERFGQMNLRTLGQGMVAVGIALAMIGGAMRAFPPNMILTAAGLVLVAIALQGIVRAIKTLGGMSVEELAKGLIGLGVAIGILAGGLYVMSGTLAGAIALGIAASGLALLIPQLVVLGSLSWKTIVTALLALAGAFAVIGVAGALITPAIPGLLGLGAALLLIGAGIALIGVGLGLIGTGLSALIVALPTGVGVMLAAFVQFTEGVIENAKLLILGILEIVQAIAEVAPEFVAAIVTILSSLIEGLIELTPKFFELVQALLDGLLLLIIENTPDIVAAGFVLLMALLQGIRDNIAEITVTVVEILNEFVNGLIASMPMIVTMGARLLVSFLNGVTNNLGILVPAVIRLVTQFVNTVANNLGPIISAGANLIIKFINGLGQNAGRIVTAGTNAVLKFIAGLGENTLKLARGAMQVILDFLKGLKTAIDEKAPDITEAAVDIGVALISGVIEGLWNKAEDLGNAIIDIAKDMIPGWARKALGIDSPSKVFMEIGEQIMDGWAQGITENANLTENAVTDAAIGMSKAVSKVPFDDLFDIAPVITPVLDLTQVRDQAKELTALTNVTPITAAASSRAAAAISVAQPVVADEQAVVGGTQLNFEQNNYSPTALSEIEIYRQTRNQLSRIQAALANA